MNSVNQFPCYMKERECIKIYVAIEIIDSDRLVFYSNNGITLNFESTLSNYKIYINEKNVIEK